MSPAWFRSYACLCLQPFQETGGTRINIHTLTFAPEFQSKSLEEIRFEDQGPGGGAQASSGGGWSGGAQQASTSGGWGDSGGSNTGGSQNQGWGASNSGASGSGGSGWGGSQSSSPAPAPAPASDSAWGSSTNNGGGWGSSGGQSSGGDSWNAPAPAPAPSSSSGGWGAQGAAPAPAPAAASSSSGWGDTSSSGGGATASGGASGGWGSSSAPAPAPAPAPASSGDAWGTSGSSTSGGGGWGDSTAKEKDKKAEESGKSASDGWGGSTGGAWASDSSKKDDSKSSEGWGNSTSKDTKKESEWGSSGDKTGDAWSSGGSGDKKAESGSGTGWGDSGSKEADKSKQQEGEKPKDPEYDPYGMLQDMNRPFSSLREDEAAKTRAAKHAYLTVNLWESGGNVGRQISTVVVSRRDGVWSEHAVEGQGRLASGNDLMEVIVDADARGQHAQPTPLVRNGSYSRRGLAPLEGPEYHEWTDTAGAPAFPFGGSWDTNPSSSNAFAPPATKGSRVPRGVSESPYIGVPALHGGRRALGPMTLPPSGARLGTRGVSALEGQNNAAASQVQPAEPSGPMPSQPNPLTSPNVARAFANARGADVDAQRASSNAPPNQTGHVSRSSMRSTRLSFGRAPVRSGAGSPASRRTHGARRPRLSSTDQWDLQSIGGRTPRASLGSEADAMLGVVDHGSRPHYSFTSGLHDDTADSNRYMAITAALRADTPVPDPSVGEYSLRVVFPDGALLCTIHRTNTALEILHRTFDHYWLQNFADVHPNEERRRVLGLPSSREVRVVDESAFRRESILSKLSLASRPLSEYVVTYDGRPIPLDESLPAIAFATATKPGDTVSVTLEPADAEEDADHTSPPVLSERRIREGYRTSPPLAQLQRMSSIELARVDNFRVTREGYGQVVWLAPVDLRGVNLDEVVQFPDCYGEVVFFNDDAKQKPPKGAGVNHPVIVSLEGVFPWGTSADAKAANRLPQQRPDDWSDKTLREQSQFLRGEIARQFEGSDTSRFMDYIPQSGRIIFEMTEL